MGENSIPGSLRAFTPPHERSRGADLPAPLVAVLVRALRGMGVVGIVHSSSAPRYASSSSARVTKNVGASGGRAVPRTSASIPFA
jgi:hypothetical protein